MKYNIKIIVFFIILGSMVACKKDHFNNTDHVVNDFVWKGLNAYYLWQQDVPVLGDNRFETQMDLNKYLVNYSDPIDLFNNLLFQRDITDRFSVIFEDYTVLENILQGTENSNGVVYGLFISGSSGVSDVVGWVKYILPNSNASDKNIKRGDFFYAVNGIPLNRNNYKELLALNSYTLSMATYHDEAIIPKGEKIHLTKTPFSENPVHLVQTYTIDGHKIGYLAYHAFYGMYDAELNNAFTQLMSENITDLVLDLRYNSGGLISSATRLASMITGQFTGEIFAKEQWNNKLEGYYQAIAPESLINTFTDKLQNGTTISSLRLNRLYILTSATTASASELLINGLKPYIHIIQIGDVTLGKNVGSVTLYDSYNFGSRDKNPKHRYAMQPIVLKTVNKDGFGDYGQGLYPDILMKEDYGNLGVLGNVNEPLLKRAIDHITGKSFDMNTMKIKGLEHSGELIEVHSLKSEMYTTF